MVFKIAVTSLKIKTQVKRRKHFNCYHGSNSKLKEKNQMKTEYISL